MHGNPATLRLNLPCELPAVRNAVKSVHRFLREHGFHGDQLMPLDLALVEACSNAIKYAGPDGAKFSVGVEAVCDAAQVEFRIHDHTPGFEWPRKFELPGPESENGRGLYLIHSLMDYAGYFRGRDGNILVLRKSRVDSKKNNTSPESAPESRDRKLAQNDRVTIESVEEQIGQRLVKHELEIAKNIQRSLLPETLPRIPGFSLAAFCRSAREVGGDFYDVLRINDFSALLVIADVMGKGIPAAMFASILRSLLRAAPELAGEPAALLTRVNRQLFPELSGVDMFITAQLAFIDAGRRQLITASAGHCPLAVAHCHEVKTFSPEGMPLGILPGTTFQDECVELPENCRVLLYTDGLSEAINAKRELFSHERLMRWLQHTTDMPRTADELKTDLLRELDSHQSNAGVNDDQTFLIVAG